MFKELQTDEDLSEYLGVALYAQSGGFSKGTANVSHHDVTKLKGLLKYYAKKPHPFTACVKDNRKRFGAHTEQYCAVLKDLIVGNTKWRNQGKKNSKGTHLSEEILNELYHLEIPEGFYEWLSESEFDVEKGEESVELSTGDVAWSSNTSTNAIRSQIEALLNVGNSDPYEPYSGGVSYWVEDLSGSEALVCAGSDHYVAPFSVDKKGVVTLSDETDWTPVNKEWVEKSANFSLSEQLGAELMLADDESIDEGVELGDDGLVWKTILREGTWKMSPGPGQKPTAKPITVVKNGASDGKSLTISIEEIKNNFEAGAVEHVTIPTSHADKVHENTGFVKGLRIETDSKGRQVLKAGMNFTEPDIKEKALRGTIANTSAGILFDYVNKSTGKKSAAVLQHAALTNHPWLDDMDPFGSLLASDSKVLAFSEEQIEVNPDETSGGGDVMEDKETATPKFLTDLGLSEDEAAVRLARYEELERRDRENTIKTQVDEWQNAKKAPALVAVAKTLLSASNTNDSVLNLSEDGKTVELSATDIIKRLMDAAPALALAEDKVNDEAANGDKPVVDASEENEEANLSQEEKTLIGQLFLDEGLSKTEAIAEAKRRLGAKS